MSDPVKTRAYRSERRRAQAVATRRAVLLAARDLFVLHGYAGTTVAAIARHAKVSVDTVYASVGRKPQLLLAVHDLELGGGQDVPAEQRDYVVALRAAEGARAKIEVYAAALGRLLPRTVPLAEALRVAGTTDAECFAVWRGLSERRAANMRLFAQDLRATGEVREDLSNDEVADLVWATNSPEFYGLMTSRGWTPEQYAALVADLWSRTILDRS